MSQLDDLFRDGLGARKADVPYTTDLWARINAAKNTPLPTGEALDKTFRNSLADRQATVPAGMWERIAAARGRRPLTRWLAATAALLLLVFAGGLGYSLLDEEGITVPEQQSEQIKPEVSVVQQSVDKAPQAPEASKAPEALSLATKTRAVNERAGNENESINENRAANETRNNETRPLHDPATEDGPPALVGEKESGGVPTLDSRAKLATPVGLITGEPIAALPVSEDLPAVDIVPGKFKSTAALRGFQTELLFGLSYANQQLTEAGPETTALRVLRESSEYPVAGYQVTLRSSYRFNDRFRLLAGLTYAEIRNEMDYNLLVNGATVGLSTNNHIRMLEAPILVGYTLPGQRFNVTANLGPVINLTTSARGRFQSPDSVLPLDLRTEGDFRKNVGVGFMASLTTAYQIGKKRPFTLLIEPFFKAYPTAFTVKGASLRESYWVAGLQFGVRKSL